MVVPMRYTTCPTDGEPEHNRRTSAQQPTRFDDDDDDDNTEAQQVLVLYQVSSRNKRQHYRIRNLFTAELF
jgi:hypothetical protein